MTKDDATFTGFSIVLTFVVIMLIVGMTFGISALTRKYSVWSSGQAGKAELMQADWNRQIAIREAEAKQQAAKALAQAEIERAKGVAEANRIIGDSLKGNEEYLRYLWIDGLQNAKNQVVYVPTEANLPILEASRLNSSAQPADLSKKD
jgi:regulator of protease activity HflC (stomatin/prohibitin superfamily)